MDSVPSLERISHCLAEQVLDLYCLWLGTALMTRSLRRKQSSRHDSSTPLQMFPVLQNAAN